MLVHVQKINSVKETLDSINIVFQRHTLLNELCVRRNLYTVITKNREKMLSYIIRAPQLRTILKEMNVDIDGKEPAVAILDGLPTLYETS